jgi:lysyl-tRNA synthetase class 2
VQIELSEEEKNIIAMLNKNENTFDLTDLKQKTGLSGKKWDASMKNLSKHNLIKVSLNGESKTITFIG